MGTWAGARCGRQHSWLDCGQGRPLGCSCYLGFGLAAPGPRFLGTQPPCATQVLMYILDFYVLEDPPENHRWPPF